MSSWNNARIAGIALLLVGFILAGCSSSLSDLRKVTYPPDFNYIEPQTISTDMARMAAQISQLDNALLPLEVDDQDAKATQQEKVVAALNNIARIASGLQASSAGSNHPYMQDSMGTFVAKVDRARSAASLAEPRYYYAGKVAGACAACHQINRQ